MTTKESIFQDNTNTSQSQQKLLYPPYQYYFHHTQMNDNRQKMLNSLQQIGYDVNGLDQKPIIDFIKQSENPLRQSYSVKVVAIKDGEIGVLSKRLEMKSRSKAKTTKSEKISTPSVPSKPTSNFVINNYFYPKYLKALKKASDPKDDDFKQKLLKWQAEQYEKLKGVGSTNLPYVDDDFDKNGDMELQSKRLVIAGLGGVRKMEKGKYLPQVNRMKMGQLKFRETHQSNDFRYTSVRTEGNNNEVYAVISGDLAIKKLSYSRLLADLTEKDILQAPQQLLIAAGLQQNVSQTPKKDEGIIYELDEEQEQSPDQQLKLPQISKKMQIHEFPQADSDNMQKRLKKIQDRLQQQ